MWKELITSIGFGNVVVDTKVKKKQYQVGETISGVVEIKGGMVRQEIESVILTLVIQYEQDKEDSDFSYHQKEIAEVMLNEVDFVQAKETIILPFSMTIPLGHLRTTENTETFLRTKLVIPYAVDAVDEDKIIIV